VILDSGAGDLIVNGSVVKAEQNIYITAKNVELTAAYDITVHDSFTEKHGFFFDAFAGRGASGYSAGVSFGWKSDRTEVYDYKSLAQVSALVANGSIIVEATQDVTSQSAQLYAGLDVTVHAGGNLSIESAYDVVNHRETHDTEQIGLTASVGENVSGAVTTIMNAPKDWNAGEGGQVYELITQASTALRTAEAAYGLVMGPLVSANLSLGYSSSHSEADSNGSYAHVGVMQAGRDLEMTSGADLGIQGTQIAAGRFLVAEAAGALTIQSALSHIHQSSESESRNASIGVSAGIGLQGFSVSGSVSAGFQNADSETTAVTNSNALLSAGGTVTIKSGKDTTVAGAKVEGAQVVADVGGDLKVESRQDTIHSESSKRGASLSLGVGLGAAPLQNESGGFNTGMLDQAANGVKGSYENGVGDKQKTGTLGLVYGEGSRDRAWTEQQTSIVGTNGVDLKVGGNTHLKGSVINSPNGEVSLDTKTLTYEELKDYDRSKNVDVNVSLSYSWGGPEPKDGKEPTPQQRAAAGNVFKTTGFKLDGSYEDTNKEGVSRATVGAGGIAVRDQAGQQKLEETGKTGKLAALNRDLAKAQEVTRDDRHYVKFYVSDTSVKAVYDVVKKAVEYVDQLVKENKLLDKEARKVKEFLDHVKNGDVDLDSFEACGPRQNGWLNDLFISTAHAGTRDGCILLIKGYNGLKKLELSPEEYDAAARAIVEGATAESPMRSSLNCENCATGCNRR
jgi:filamentous hemagglutinin